MTKSQIKLLRMAALVLVLLLTASVIQQTLAQRKSHEAYAAQQAEVHYDQLAFDLLKSWTYVEGKTPIPEFIKALDGRDVVMLGFMMPLNDVDHIQEFLLMPSLFGCCYGRPPAANHIVAVKLPAGQTTKFYSNPVQVKGRFQVGETKQDGYLLSLYVLTADKIVEAKGRE